MKNYKYFLALVALIINFFSFGQLHIVDMSKTPLSFQNPSLQIEKLDNFALSLNGINQPGVEDTKDIFNYLGLVEVNLGKKWHLGVQTNHLENKIFYETEYKMFLSKSFELDEGHFFNMGFEMGFFEEMIKPGEFNAVLTPNKFIYTDSVNTGLDFGLGLAYLTDHATFGYSIKKLNRPLLLPFPSRTVSFIDDTTFFVVDTTIMYGKNNRIRSGFRHSVHFLYHWNYSSKIKINHALYLADIITGSIGFTSLQNNVEFNEKFNLGVGVIYASTIGFSTNTSFWLSKKINFGVSAYFTQNTTYNIVEKKYDVTGYSPWIEGRLLIKI
jgi:hypothetical protein